jgi:hypothetical protein
MGNDGDNADKGKEGSQADDGTTQNVEDWGHRTTECEDWTVNFTPIKYENEEADATATSLSEEKTELSEVKTLQSYT